MYTKTSPNVETWIMGSGLLDAYPWWVISEDRCEREDQYFTALEGWEWIVTPLDPDSEEPGEPVTITHGTLMDAIRKVTKGAEVSKACRAACWLVVFGRDDEVDFDAASADEVLQIAVYGEVVFG